MKFFSTILLASSAIAAPALTSWKAKRALSSGDFALINLARNLESLELNYWNQLLGLYNDSAFTGPLQDFRKYITLFRDQEIAHFTVLNDAAGGGFQNCTYNFGPMLTANLTSALAMAQVVTTVGEGAFIGAESKLENGTLRQGGAGILGVEARSNSLIREKLGLDFFNAVNIDTALTASQAFSLAAPFFYVAPSSCPSSNAAINFPLIPPLNATFANGGMNTTHKANDTINVAWDSSKVYLGNDVHIRFLSDVNMIDAPLMQMGNGMGTVQLPKYINGTAFLVATNYHGMDAIPDGQNFAIGFLVVA